METRINVYSRHGGNLDFIPRELLQVVERTPGFILCQYICSRFPQAELRIIIKHIREDLIKFPVQDNQTQEIEITISPVKYTGAVSG